MWAKCIHLRQSTHKCRESFWLYLIFSFSFFYFFIFNSLPLWTIYELAGDKEWNTTQLATIAPFVVSEIIHFNRLAVRNKSHTNTIK